MPEFIMFAQGPLPYLPRTTVIENPKTGLGPMYSAIVVCFANLSASSLHALSL